MASGICYRIDDSTRAIVPIDHKEKATANSDKGTDAKGRTIANFFIVPQYHITVDYFCKKEKLIYLEVVSLKHEVCTCLILNYEELNSIKWIVENLDPSVYVLVDEYKRFKDIISATMLYDDIEHIEIQKYYGWNKSAS